MATIKQIEKASIKVTGKSGNRYRMQCLKEDIDKLILRGISNGSVCLVLDASETDAKTLIFHQSKLNEDGNWYPIKESCAGQGVLSLVYDESEQIVK